jgi:hypothetical protein
MRKVLISAISACALATVAQAADDMLPSEEVREAAPIGLVGEPWPPGSELGASNFTERPLVLVPREYNAQASVPLANCPPPNAADDEALCQRH